MHRTNHLLPAFIGATSSLERLWLSIGKSFVAREGHTEISFNPLRTYFLPKSGHVQAVLTLEVPREPLWGMRMKKGGGVVGGKVKDFTLTQPYPRMASASPEKLAGMEGSANAIPSG